MEGPKLIFNGREVKQFESHFELRCVDSSYIKLILEVGGQEFQMLMHECEAIRLKNWLDKHE